MPAILDCADLPVPTCALKLLSWRVTRDKCTLPGILLTLDGHVERPPGQR